MNVPHRLIYWHADAIAAWERVAPTSEDDRHARVALCSPSVEADSTLELILSWTADTPPGSWVEVQLQACYGGDWDRWLRIGVWDAAPAESRRTSFDAQRGPEGYVATDTVVLSRPPEVVQARVLLCAEPGADMPELEALALCLSQGKPATTAPILPVQPSELVLPLLLSQYSFEGEAGWCSPTSLVMVLAYWHQRTGDPRLAPFRAPEMVPAVAAPMVYDPELEGTGNWSFNTAFAASLGLVAYVTRLHSLEQLGRWTAAGVPVIVSVAWREGEIEGAPGKTPGHLTIVRGLRGDRVLMAEPASRDLALINRTYPSTQLFAAWQKTSSGTVYLLHPQGWPRPEPGTGDAWV